MKANNMMKKFLVACSATAMAAVAMAAAKTIQLADARAEIESAVSDPAKVTSLMSQLSAADQQTFLADVNATIAKLPASGEERAKLLLDANRAALKVATKDTAADLLAVTYATATPEALTIINEEFAKDVVSRSADPSHSYTDEQFAAIASNMVSKVAERTAGLDDAAARNAFAAMTFLRASNGTPEGLADQLVAATGAGEKEAALMKNEWLPEALGDPSSYESILGYIGAGQAPQRLLTLSISDPLASETLLWLIGSGMTDTSEIFTPEDGVSVSVGDLDRQLTRVPRTTNRNLRWYPRYTRDNPGPRVHPVPPTPVPPPEPPPYPNQNTGR